MFWNTLKNIILLNRWFYFPYTVLLMAGIAVQLTCTQFEISLFINGFHTTTFDFIFNYLTNLGDGMFAVAVVIAIYLFRKPHTIQSILCFVVPALLTQFLKRLVFAGHYRPSVRMKAFTELHYVPGVNMHEFNSFPSGHTTSAFAIFLFLSLISTNKRLGLAFLAVSLLIGLSRIYLLQHFYEDVLAGSLIGVTGTTLIYTIFETRRATQK
ncbi:MAG: phosphatase PAP2 family protein [Bacteroidota bacterium]